MPLDKLEIYAIYGLFCCGIPVDINHHLLIFLYFCHIQVFWKNQLQFQGREFKIIFLTKAELDLFFQSKILLKLVEAIQMPAVYSLPRITQQVFHPKLEFDFLLIFNVQMYQLLVCWIPIGKSFSQNFDNLILHLSLSLSRHFFVFGDEALFDEVQYDHVYGIVEKLLFELF